MNIVILIITVLAVLVPLLHIGAAFFALKQKRQYKTSISDLKFKPFCSIILPCKGSNPQLEKNLRSFFNLSYNRYEVIFTVESREDSAVPVIEKILEEYPNSKLVIAGITEKCGQKNYNLVKAIDQAKNPDILIFADSDIHLFPQWISKLIHPLNDESITAVTGFRWLYPTGNRMGDLAHSLQNFILFSLFCTANHKSNTGLWGGSMAIRKADYMRLNVRNTWLETSVDDMSLSETIKRKGESTVFAYDCITPTDDTIKSLRTATYWFERQVMYLKAHQRTEWYAAVVAAFAFMGSYFLLPYALIRFFLGDSFLLTGGIAWIIQTLSVIFFTLLFPVFGQKGRWGSFIIASPISFFSAAAGTIRTLFTNKITWSGFRYTVRYSDGVVTNVEKVK